MLPRMSLSRWRPGGFPRKQTFQDWQALGLRLRPGLVAGLCLRHGLGLELRHGFRLWPGKKSSNLPSPAGGICLKVLVPANNLQAINSWVQFTRSVHSAELSCENFCSQLTWVFAASLHHSKL